MKNKALQTIKRAVQLNYISMYQYGLFLHQYVKMGFFSVMEVNIF